MLSWTNTLLIALLPGILALECDLGHVASFGECQDATAFLVGGSMIGSDLSFGFSPFAEVFGSDVEVAPYPHSIDAPVSVWIDDHVLVCGGRQQELEDGPVTNECLEYWPCSNEWKLGETPPMLMTRVGASGLMVTMDEKRYFWALGGSQSDDSQSVPATEYLDLDTNTWMSGPNLTEGRFSSCPFDMGGGSVMLSGGFPSYSNNEWINLVSGTYISEANHLHGRWGHGCAPLANEQLLVVGGLDENFISLNTCEIFDGSSWSAGPSMPTSRTGMTVLHMDGKATLFGGIQAAAFLHRNVFQLDLEQGEWIELEQKLKGAHVSGSGTLVPKSIFENCP